MWKINFSTSHRFKISVALVAALALTATMASTASAQFTSNKEHTILSGSQKTGTNDVFTVGSGFGGITCENTTFTGTSTGKHWEVKTEKTTHTGYEASTQVITPESESCKDSLGRTVDGSMSESEKLTLTFTSGAGKGTAHVSGSVTASVTSGGSVVCTVVIKTPQTNNGVTYTNLGGTKGVEVTIHANNVVSTTSGGFFNCGISNGEHTSGTYDGVAVVTGQDTSFAAAEISVD
jgi:uncharacterized membrane protein